MTNSPAPLTSRAHPVPGPVARTLNAFVPLSPLSNPKRKELELHPSYREVTDAKGGLVTHPGSYSY